jgi:uncharacterized protein (DUF58 family)
MSDNSPFSLDERLRKIQIKLRLKPFSKNRGLGKATQKGYGSEFHQLRDYQSGDDVRSIDWKSSARTGKLFVKEHLQEQQYSILLLIDQSGSMATSSSYGQKYTAAQEVGVIITYIAQQTASRIGAVFFTDTLQEIIYPLAGHNHYASVMQKIMHSKSIEKSKTDLVNVFSKLQGLVRSNTIVCVISDCIDDNSKWHTTYRRLIHSPCLFLKIVDPLEKEFFNQGIVHIVDAETGRSKPIFADEIHRKANFFITQNSLIQTSLNRFCTVTVGSDIIDTTVPFLVRTLSSGSLI